MNIKLSKLTLSNFQGVKSFTLSLSGDTKIYGDNGTGKTTLFNAFLWLLFGKDYQGRTDFQVKPIGEDGEEIHGLDTSVNATLDINGTVTEFEKVYSEKWTKKRGEAEKLLTGHETNFKIDSVPVTKKEWDAKIAELVNEETFRLLTNPMHFNSLHWSKRREILMDLGGNISNADVIASNAELNALSDVLSGRSVNDHKKVLMGKKKEINERIAQIPARIDELTNSQPELSIDVTAAEKQIKELTDKIDSIRSGSNVEALKTSLLLAQQELSKLKAEREADAVKRKHDYETDVRGLNTQLNNNRADMANLENIIVQHESELLNLREKFTAINLEVFESSDICQTCGQDLPEHMVDAAKEAFNQNKAKRLEHINQCGKDKKAKINEAQKNIEVVKETISALEESINLITIVETDLNLAKIADQEQIITALNIEIEKAGDSIDTKELEQQKAELQQQIAANSNAERTRARIKELSEEEKKLGSEISTLEKELYLLEKFIVAKVGMLENSINNRFKLAKFKMFETQINGGINETCITTDKNGVPFGSGLNNAACINVGLDIIQTLSNHYDTKAPVFIDNAEASTNIIPIDSQSIELIVDANCKKLTVK